MSLTARIAAGPPARKPQPLPEWRRRALEAQQKAGRLIAVLDTTATVLR